MRILILLLLSTLISVSAYSQKRRLIRDISKAEDSIGYHAGFFLYDPVRKEVLVDYKGDRYFTPASNTKIFTLYTSMSVLGDSIPGAYYQYRGDSIIMWGSGDPSLFYERIQNSSFVEKVNALDLNVSQI